MKINKKWRDLGWRHPIWDYVRFYSVVRGQKREMKNNWLNNMRASKLEIVPGQDIPIDPDHAQLFFDYLDSRDEDGKHANELLRTEEESLSFCSGMQVEAIKNVTQLAGYYQSSKSLIAAVTVVARLVCDEKKIAFVASPQRRCAWLIDNHLHVTARNLDGAIPN